MEEQGAVNEGPVDLLVMGPPCQAWSTARSGRFEEDGVINHEAASVTLEGSVALLSQVSPKCVIFENVRGFMLPLATGDDAAPTTPFDLLVEAMERNHLKYSVKIHESDAAYFSSVTRRRHGRLNDTTSILQRDCEQG